MNDSAANLPARINAGVSTEAEHTSTDIPTRLELPYNQSTLIPLSADLDPNTALQAEALSTPTQASAGISISQTKQD